MSKPVKVINKGMFGGAYFLMWVGALVYFVQRSEGFGEFLLAIIKSCVWPALLVHRAFVLMGM